jgi:hypothetical protein
MFPTLSFAPIRGRVILAMLMFEAIFTGLPGKARLPIPAGGRIRQQDSYDFERLSRARGAQCALTHISPRKNEPFEISRPGFLLD